MDEPSRERAVALVVDALTAARDVTDMVVGYDADTFAADRMRRLAVERQMITLGEALTALRRLVPDLVAALPAATQAIALRHVLVHGYAVIDVGRLWDAASNHLPLLSEALVTLKGRL